MSRLYRYTSVSGLLSQWRGYAEAGGGYCVVFDEDALDNLVKSERRISPSVTVLKNDIRYVGDDGPDASPTSRLDFLDLAAFVKNEMLRVENETRITLAVPPQGPRTIRFREAAKCSPPNSRYSRAPASSPSSRSLSVPAPSSGAAGQASCSSSAPTASTSASTCRRFRWPGDLKRCCGLKPGRDRWRPAIPTGGPCPSRK